MNELTGKKGVDVQLTGVGPLGSRFEKGRGQAPHPEDHATETGNNNPKPRPGAWGRGDLSAPVVVPGGVPGGGQDMPSIPHRAALA